MSNDNAPRTHSTQTKDTTKTLTRRRWLSGLAAGAATLAGCASNSANDSQANTSPKTSTARISVPEFTVDDDAQPTPMVLDAVTLADTDSITFLDEFTVRIAVANVGGAALTSQSVKFALEYLDGTGSQYQQTVNAPDAVSVDLPDLDSGEWDTVEVQLRVNAGGSWKLTTDARTHPSFDHQINSEPKRLAPRESITSDVGRFKITALEPRYEQALHYVTEEGGVGLFNEKATGLVSTKDSEVLVIHRFRIENTSEDQSVGFGTVLVDNQFTDATVTSTPGAALSRDDMRDSLNTLVLSEGTAAFGNNKIEPGETKDLAAIQSVPVEEVSNASLTLSLWGDSSDIVFESPTAVPALPQFELVDATISDGDGENPVIEMTVENTGDGSGTFRGAGQFYETRPTASNWVYLPEGVEAPLKSGARETLRITASRGNEKYRVLPFEQELQR